MNTDIKTKILLNEQNRIGFIYVNLCSSVAKKEFKYIW